MGARVGDLHHVEIWVADLESAIATWGWLLTELGYSLYQEWPNGRSWRLNATYIVIERSPALSDQHHDRLRPGLNHLAFHAGTASDVERLTTDAQSNGWRLLFPDTHPHAGGVHHDAAYLDNAEGFEIELCATGRLS